MKTSIIIGRFQPMTTAHYNIILKSIETYENTVVVIINSKSSIIANSLRRSILSGNSKYKMVDLNTVWKNQRKSGIISSNYTNKKLGVEVEKNPFSGKTRKNIIFNSLDGKLPEHNIITNTSADFTEIIKKIKTIYNTNDFVIQCGTDRVKTYQNQIDNYFDSSLGNIYLDIVDRDIDSADNVSATVVRESLYRDDIDTYKSNTPSKMHEYYNFLRRRIYEAH